MRRIVLLAAWIAPVGLMGGVAISGLAGNGNPARGRIQSRPNLAPLWLRIGDPRKPDNGNQVFGTAAALGDVDGDGFDELLMGDWSFATWGHVNSGGVHVFHGPGLRYQQTIMAPDTAGFPPEANFGSSVACGDVDGNGIDEVAVGAPAGGGVPAELYLFRNGDFDTPWVSASVFGLHWGSEVAIDDVDGDGLEDLISVDGFNGAMGIYLGPVGTANYGYPDISFQGSAKSAPSFATGDLTGDGIRDIVIGDPVVTGNLWVYEGGAWTLAAQIPQPVPDSKQISGLFGQSVAIADVDQDGVMDIIAGAPGKKGKRTGNILSGEVQIFYGPDYTRWKSLLPPHEVKQGRYGDQVGVLDLDLDGQLELLIAATGASWASNAPKAQGVVEVRGTPSFLREGELVPGYTSGMPYSRAFGTVLAHGDLNADGAEELIIGAPIRKIPGGGYNSFTWAYVQVPQHDLGVDRLVLRQGAGGTLRLQLDAGSANASKPYLMLASSSGTMPGTWIGGTHVPLNPDALQAFLLSVVNSGSGGPFLTGWQGVLDTSGKALAAFTLPPGSFPGLAGTTLSFAYLAGKSYGYASLPVSVEIASGPYRGSVAGG